MAADCADRFQMAQKPGQVLEVVPEPEQLLHRLIDGDALFDLDACAMFDARAKSFALRGADAQRLIESAMAGRASIDQCAAGDRRQQPVETPSFQPVYRQSASTRYRDEALAIADVDWPVMSATFDQIRRHKLNEDRGSRIEDRVEYRRSILDPRSSIFGFLASLRAG